MKEKKYKKELTRGVLADKRQAEAQARLREKYETREDVFVVEKANTVKFIVRTCVGIIKGAAAILIFFFAVTGLAAILYPESRVALTEQALHIYREILRLVF